MRNHATTTILILAIVLGLALIPNIAAPNKPQGFLSTKGTLIVDATGRIVLLRGVNYAGYESSASEPKTHRESAYASFALHGFNVVRLPISWANLEQAPGMFSESYLTYYVDRDLRWAKKYGLYIVLDMHQYDWATKFGGDGGAPYWTVQKYPPTEIGMRQAVSEFWNSSTLQDHLINVWAKIAQKYAKEPAIAGYDLLNEPFVYTSIIPNLNGTFVNAFYMRAISAIRMADQNHIIFIEPANMDSSKSISNRNIVWSPHFYPLSFYPKYYPENITLLEADLKAKYQKFVVERGQPMWIGEFASFMGDGSSMTWLQDSVRLFHKYGVGWAWWTYEDHARRPTVIPTCLFLPSV